MTPWRIIVSVCVVAGVVSALGDAWISGESPNLLAGVLGGLVGGIGFFAMWWFYLQTSPAASGLRDGTDESIYGRSRQRRTPREPRRDKPGG
jgi:hypothetical protein